MKKCFSLLLAVIPFLSFAQSTDSAWVVNNYKKTETMVPMRDGTKLFTTIYAPKDNTEKHPILLIQILIYLFNQISQPLIIIFTEMKDQK